VETGLPRPILPIGAIREVREIVDRSGVARPPVEVMPLPANDFQSGDMTAEMLRDPRFKRLNNFERNGGEASRSPAGGKPVEEEDAPYQLELSAQKALVKARSEALETMLAYERIGRGARRAALAPKARNPAGAKMPVSAPRPPEDGEQDAPANPRDGKTEAKPRPPIPAGEEMPPYESAQTDTLLSSDATPPGAAQPPDAAQAPDTAQALKIGEKPENARPDAERDAPFFPTEKDNVPPDAHGASRAAPPGERKAPPAAQKAAPDEAPAAWEIGGKAAAARGLGAREIEPSAQARAAVAQSGAPESRGSLENLQRLAKLPFHLYLFGGEMPRYTDEEEARAIRSRRARRAEPDWTAETLTMADAVRLAAVLHNVCAGGDGAFEQGKPWYMPYLRYALEHGLVGAEEFGAPDEPVTRGHLADILARCVPDEALPAINPDAVVPDVKEGVGYGSSAIKMVRAGVFAPVGPLKLFDPERLVMRREAAVYAGRILTPPDRRRF